MTRRRARNVILLYSVAAVIAVCAVAISAWRNDRVISSASAATYRELRLQRGQMRVTLLSAWPDDVPRRAGSTTRPVSGLTFGSTGSGVFRLLDGAHVALRPTKQPAWRLWESGNAAIPDASPGIRRTARRLPVPQTSQSIGTNTIVNQVTNNLRGPLASRHNVLEGRRAVGIAPRPATLPPSATAPFSFDVTVSSLTSPSNSSATEADDLLTAIRSSSDLAMTTKPKPPRADTETQPRVTWTLTSATWPTYPYQSYRLPYWLAGVVLLLPMWTLLSLGALLWQRGRSRRRRGLCVSCGYDLRASVGACPECGQERAAQLAG